MATRPLDCSDIDQHLGKPIESSPVREPIGNNDIRRWVQAMHYPNLLHYDPAYAAASRWGRDAVASERRAGRTAENSSSGQCSTA